MDLNIITINPDFFISPCKNGILNKAIKKKKINLFFWNLMDFIRKKSFFEDKIYGGGFGLLIRPESLYFIISRIKKLYKKSLVIYLSPQGNILNKFIINKLLNYYSLIFICGRYNGIDQRIIDNYVDIEISIGNYIISCGEIATLVVIDSLVRYIPGVLNNINSTNSDSFNFLDKFLGYPNYTKPKIFNGLFIPRVLLSGNHKKIFLWRYNKSFIKTIYKKPYLLNDFFLSFNKKK